MGEKKICRDPFAVRKFRSFPESLDEAVRFLASKGLEPEQSDLAALEAIVGKVNKKSPVDKQEAELVHRLLDLGDTCGCDSDHRIRRKGEHEKSIGYSET